jgi:hypothetical protein
VGERRFTFFTYRERFRFFDVAVVREGCFFPFFFAAALSEEVFMFTRRGRLFR